MKTGMFGIAALVAFAGAAVAQDISQVNGYHTWGRLFADFPDSSLTINGVNTPDTGAPGPEIGSVSGLSTLHFVENFPTPPIAGFANKHVGWLSADNGASRFQTNVYQSFTLSFNVRMNAPSGFPRKEAGIEFWQNRPGLGFNDEGQLLIASDGEVAVFGATLPFTGLGNVYTLGTTASVTWEYFAPGVMHATKGAYRLTFIDAVTGTHSSGVKVWGNEPDGIVGHTAAYIGLKAQNQRNPFIQDSSDILYSNVNVIPSPAGLALLGVGALAASRRRR